MSDMNTDSFHGWGTGSEPLETTASTWLTCQVALGRTGFLCQNTSTPPASCMCYDIAQPLEP